MVCLLMKAKKKNTIRGFFHESQENLMLLSEADASFSDQFIEGHDLSKYMMPILKHSPKRGKN